MSGNADGDDRVDVSVIVPTYNRARLLHDTFAALFVQQTPPGLSWEIIIVDNNSRDSTRALVSAVTGQAPAPVRYLFEPHQGKSRAINAGIKEARGSIIALTDDDVSPAPDWVATAATVLDRWGADGAGGRILPRWEAEPPAWLLRSERLCDHLSIMEFAGPSPLSLPGTRYPQVWGANMILRRAVVLELGGFDVTLGPVGDRRYCEEDCDVVRRMLQAGHRIAYDPALTVYHRIPLARLRRGHFRRIVWDKAEGQALSAHAPTEPCLFGAPWWRYRDTARLLIRWIRRLLARRHETFDAQLDIFAEAGTIWGYIKRAAREARSQRAKSARAERTF